jgi:hypothetical protein
MSGDGTAAMLNGSTAAASRSAEEAQKEFEMSATRSSAAPHRTRIASVRVETKFLRLKEAPSLGTMIEGWRVCWLGGWDRGRIFFVVMVERKVPACRSATS